MTKDRPLIGINTEYCVAAKGRNPHSFMHSGYYDCVLAAGGLPVMIPPLIKEHDLAPILERLDGVVLAEGTTSTPRRWASAPTPPSRSSPSVARRPIACSAG